jgi:hypothetical protein
VRTEERTRGEERRGEERRGEESSGVKTTVKVGNMENDQQDKMIQTLVQ